MTVYVVDEGIVNEGGETWAVTESLESAKKAAQRFMDSRPSEEDEWRQIEMTGFVCYWTDHNDQPFRYVSIKRWDVTP